MPPSNMFPEFRRFNLALGADGQPSSHYSDAEPAKDGAWLQLLGFSDYSGSCLDAANLAAFKSLHRRALDEGNAVEVFGGHGTVALFIRYSYLETGADGGDEGAAAVFATVQGLTDYPVIDDDLLSETEMASAEENWSDWQFQDLCDDIANAHGCERHQYRDVDPSKLLTWLHEECNGRVEDEGHGVGNCSYAWDARDFKAKMNRDVAKSLGFVLIPTREEALATVQDLLDRIDVDLSPLADEILAAMDPRELRRALDSLPSLTRDAIFA